MKPFSSITSSQLRFLALVNDSSFSVLTNPKNKKIWVETRNNPTSRRIAEKLSWSIFQKLWVKNYFVFNFYAGVAEVKFNPILKSALVGRVEEYLKNKAKADFTRQNGGNGFAKNTKNCVMYFVIGNKTKYLKSITKGKMIFTLIASNGIKFHTFQEGRRFIIDNQPCKELSRIVKSERLESVLD